MDNKLISQKTLEFLIKNSYDPNTVNFAVWHYYFANTIPELNMRIKTIINSKQGTSEPERLSEKDLNKLYKDYVIRDQLTGKLGITDAADQITDKSKKMIGKINQFTKMVSDKQARLADLKESLGKAQRKKAIEMIISDAISELSEVQEVSNETTLWINDRVSQIEKQADVTRSIEQETHIDFLTGVPNRKYFNAQIKKLLESSTSGVTSKRSFIVMDIKELNRINTDYSLMLGDAVIRQGLQAIKDGIGEGFEDWTISRFHEDAFSMIPPVKTRDSQLITIVEKIMEDINKKVFNIKGMEGNPIKDLKFNTFIDKITIYDSFEDAIKKLDNSLIALKGKDGELITGKGIA